MPPFLKNNGEVDALQIMWIIEYFMSMLSCTLNILCIKTHKVVIRKNGESSRSRRDRGFCDLELEYLLSHIFGACSIYFLIVLFIKKA